MQAPASTCRVFREYSLEDEHIDALTAILLDSVEGGASVGFMSPLTFDRAKQFWRWTALRVNSGERAILLAADDQGICGTVQLILTLPENQPHRADVTKLLVHRRARKRGVGEALMRAADGVARENGKNLLVLDAVSGGDAARLYERLGWLRVGDVPRFALLPDGTSCSTTFYYRDLTK
jgi:GNAT superfamily N-acetyltransferase